MDKYTIMKLSRVTINCENIVNIKSGDYVKLIDGGDYYKILNIGEPSIIRRTRSNDVTIIRLVRLENIVTGYKFSYNIGTSPVNFELVIFIKNNKSIYNEVQ